MPFVLLSPIMKSVKISVFARSALVVCARKSDRVVCLLVCLVAEVIDFYHEDMEGSRMRLPTETLKSGSWKVSKSYPPLISLASGI